VDGSAGNIPSLLSGRSNLVLFPICWYLVGPLGFGPGFYTTFSHCRISRILEPFSSSFLHFIHSPDCFQNIGNFIQFTFILLYSLTRKIHNTGTLTSSFLHSIHWAEFSKNNGIFLQFTFLQHIHSLQCLQNTKTFSSSILHSMHSPKDLLFNITLHSLTTMPPGYQNLSPVHY